MGKFRSKLKGRTKGKRWPKGQSSSSNPETKKYRDNAKSRFFQVNLGPSSLTTDALKKHDAIHTFDSNKSDTNSVVTNSVTNDASSWGTSTFKTYDTFASDWSNCSNISFNKLLTTFRSDSALHKEMLAILAAITDVIKSTGGSESSTEYYAALMTTLESSQTEQSVAAVLSLLALGLKTVPQSVLRLQFSNATKLFLELLTQYSQSDNNVIICSLLKCLCEFLKVQEIAAWSNSSTVQVFDAILAFSNHTKPKIRKAAQHAICVILNASCFMRPTDDRDPPAHHPVGAHVAQFCIRQIESSVGSTGGQTTTLHILTLLKDIIRVFPKTQIKSVCETMLKIMTLNNVLVNSGSLEVLYSLFSGQQTVVPVLLNDQLITALYDYQPSPTDTQPTLAWVAVMKQAYIHLADVDVTTCMKRLSRIIHTLTQLWLTERPEIITSVTLSLEDIIKDCVGAVTDDPVKVKQHSEYLRQCFEIIEKCLGYQYHSAWHYILHLITVIFKIAGLNCQELLAFYLKTLASLRDSYKFSYNNELEYAVGTAIRTMGPEIVLKEIPLTNNKNEVILDRSWLLPILKDNVQKSTIEYFATHIRTLAEFCEKRSKYFFSNNDSVGGHSMELLSIQLWSLFPSFCNDATDVTTSFKKIAQVIGMKMTNTKDLRLPLMAGLRKLITQAQENEQNDNIKELSRFAKNYIPILFNVYTTKPNGTDEEGQRLAALQTIKIYVSIAPDDLRKTLFTEAQKRLTVTEESFMKESIFDIVRVLAVYQTEEILTSLYQDCIVKLYGSANHTEQKKAYRLLEDICGSDSAGCKAFVNGNKKSLKTLLLKTLDTTATSSRAARLKCLHLILFRAHNHLDTNNKLVLEALNEAVMYMKDGNERCRIEAQKIILDIGESLLKTNKSRDKYLEILITGLAGNQQMTVGSTLALASCVHHFSGSLGVENLELMLQAICQLVTSNNREIAQGALAFMKVFITRLPMPMVAAHISLIVKSLCEMVEDCKRHSRMKLKYILDRLIRKFGCDTISKFVPTDDTVMHKRLRNLRKLNARKKRLRAKKDEEDSDQDDASFTIGGKPKTVEAILADSDSEIDDDTQINEMPRSRRAKLNAWIQEDEDNIVDFTDTSAISKIRATNPLQNNKILDKQKAKKDKGFKTAPDGRLIITEDSDDSSSDNGKSNKMNLDLDDDSDDDENDSVTAPETLVLSNRKRKRAAASDTRSIFSGASSSCPPKKYQAGGSGIHRPITKAPGATYKSKKAAGDIKKKGKPDPYAYLPLKRSSLNKRKRLKSAGQFKNIVRGATKGAKKGMKAKNKRR